MKELLEKLQNSEASIDEVLKAIEDETKDRVPRSRLNDKNDEIKELKEQLASRDTQLEELKKQSDSSEELTTKIQSLQAENEQVRTEYEAKLTQKEFDFALESALRDAKTKNPKAVKALLDIQAVKLADGKIDGLEDQLKALKQSDGYLFEGDGIKGRTPIGNAGGKKTSVTKEQFDQMNYTERSQLYTESPELYKQLSTN